MGKRSMVQIKTEAALRRNRVLELALSGANYLKIAEAEKVSETTARNDLIRILGDLERKYEGKKVNQMRGLYIERLEHLLSKHWPKAMTGDGAATDRVLRIMDRQAQIMGMIPDKPLISLTQQNLQINQPFTFQFGDVDDADNGLSTAAALPETT
ncbi:hypothetical protein [uncultured Mediterranean phage uvDeep-CGR2-KM18-C74]|nr:hypothetical protein [uncultured Mediterranean phage uvDeep-CGR2-KM18-C74]